MSTSRAANRTRVSYFRHIWVKRWTQVTRFRDLDNSLTTLQQQGKDVFETPATDTVESCNGWDDPD